MFIAFVQKYKLAILVLCLLVGGGIYAGDQIYNHQANKNGIQANTDAMVYLPDSYIRYLLTAAVIKKSNEIYDDKNYDFYDIINSGTATTKSFKLVIVKKTPPNLKKGLMLAADKKALASHYAPGNFMEKKISVSLANSKITIEVEGVSGMAVKLVDYTFSKLDLLLQDSTLNHSQRAVSSVTILPHGIVAAYTKNAIFLKKGITFLESKPEYQNLGFSAMYPYSFLSTYMDTVKVNYLSDNLLAKDIRITDVKLTNKNADVVEAKFAIRHPLFPLDFTGKLEMTKSANKISGFKDVGYDTRVNLSNAERRWMNEKTKLLNDSIFPKMIDVSLVPALKKAKMTIDNGVIKIEKPIKKGQLRYSDDCVIFKIELL